MTLFRSWRPNRILISLGRCKAFSVLTAATSFRDTYPSKFGAALLGRDLYWDVIVRPTQNHPDLLEVQYYIPPNQDADIPIERWHDENGSARVHEIRATFGNQDDFIEEDFLYLVQYESPGAPYDDAQRAIYRAARGRLNLDTGETHLRNLNFAAALRQIGYEVFPISVLLSLFSRMLNLPPPYNLTSALFDQLSVLSSIS